MQASEVTKQDSDDLESFLANENDEIRKSYSKQEFILTRDLFNSYNYFLRIK